MKIRLLSLFIFLSAISYAQTDPPVRFEVDSPLIDLIDFGGNASALVVDPTDPNNNVAQSTKTAGAELWAGTSVGLNGFVNPILLGPGFTTMTVRVWSPDANIPIRLKIEDSTDPTISVETEANTTTAGAWETLSFDFSNPAPGTASINFANTYNKCSIFFNFGTTGAMAGEKTYYWDDVEYIPAMPNLLNLPVAFEEDTLRTELVDFGGNASAFVVDPTNPNNNVARSIKTGAAELWAGTSVGPNGFATPIPFASGSTVMTVRVWSPDANTPIRLKAEDSNDPGISVETEVLTTMAGDWEMLTFDFSNQVAGTAAINFANTYNKASIFFNFGTTGAMAGEKTYYWDDMDFVPGMPTGPSLPVGFGEDTLTFDLIDFGGNASAFVVDPTDPTNGVAQSTKTDVAELWAGTTIGMDGFALPVPFTNGMTTMTVRVWSPDANIPIRLKAEDSTDPTISVETEAMTTMAGAWETLTFDFSNQATGTAAINFANSYNKVSIFFNFGTTGAVAGEKTYYWDDVAFGGGMPSGPNLPVGFEEDTSSFDLIDFGGDVSTFVVDPTDPLNNVARTIKTDVAELWAGTTIGANGFDMAIPFMNGSTSMTVRVWSPDANIPIRLKAEDSNDPGISVETEAMTTMAGAWEMLTFDFSNHVAGTAAINFANTYNKASIFFNFGTTGATAGEKTYYWDDVEFVQGMPPVIALPVDFEEDTSTFDLIDFGGNASAFVVDPTDPTNNVARSTKTAAAELWAGTTIALNGFTDPVPFAISDTKMNVRVWSPDAGIQIRLKAEDSTDPTISVETEATTTVAGAWETLEFDFNNQATGTAAINFANAYNKVSIFFNFGTTGAMAGEKTYYWDDVKFGAANVGTRALNTDAYNINVYPNPASDVVNIDFPETISGQATIRLMDVTGKLFIIQTVDADQASIRLSDLATGTYVLSIEVDEKLFTKQLFVK